MIANFTPKAYTLTFDGNGGTWADHDDYGRPFNNPLAVIKDVPYGTNIYSAYAASKYGGTAPARTWACMSRLFMNLPERSMRIAPWSRRKRTISPSASA